MRRSEPVLVRHSSWFHHSTYLSALLICLRKRYLQLRRNQQLPSLLYQSHLVLHKTLPAPLEDSTSLPSRTRAVAEEASAEACSSLIRSRRIWALQSNRQPKTPPCGSTKIRRISCRGNKCAWKCFARTSLPAWRRSLSMRESSTASRRIISVSTKRFEWARPLIKWFKRVSRVCTATDCTCKRFRTKQRVSKSRNWRILKLKIFLNLEKNKSKKKAQKKRQMEKSQKQRWNKSLWMRTVSLSRCKTLKIQSILKLHRKCLSKEKMSRNMRKIWPLRGKYLPIKGSLATKTSESCLIRQVFVLPAS